MAERQRRAPVEGRAWSGRLTTRSPRPRCEPGSAAVACWTSGSFTLLGSVLCPEMVPVSRGCFPASWDLLFYCPNKNNEHSILGQQEILFLTQNFWGSPGSAHTLLDASGPWTHGPLPPSRQTSTSSATLSGMDSGRFPRACLVPEAGCRVNRVSWTVWGW